MAHRYGHYSLEMGSCMDDRCAEIMIVEDDRAIRIVLMELLQDEGYEVTCFRNGREALTCLQASRSQPKLILLDLMMPVMDGWEFCARQQQDPRLATIPVVILSATSGPGAQEPGLQALAYLAKPIRFDMLLPIVRQCCADTPAGQAPYRP